MLTLTTEEAGEHNLSSDTICNQTSMTFMCGEMIFLVETVKQFYVFCFCQLIPMQMPALARSISYYSESAVEESGWEKI